MSNSLDPDQAWCFVGPDLGPNCLQRLSADDKSCHKRGKELKDGLRAERHNYKDLWTRKYIKHFSADIIIWAVSNEKFPFKHAENVQSQIILCMCKVWPGPLFSIQIPVVPNDSISRQWRPWSDCILVQPDIGIHCPHIPKGMFSHGAAI